MYILNKIILYTIFIIFFITLDLNGQITDKDLNSLVGLQKRMEELAGDLIDRVLKLKLENQNDASSEMLELYKEANTVEVQLYYVISFFKVKNLIENQPDKLKLYSKMMKEIINHYITNRLFAYMYTQDKLIAEDSRIAADVIIFKELNESIQENLKHLMNKL